MQWTEITSSTNTWKPELNEILEGQLVQIQQNVGRNNSKLYTFVTTEDTIDVWGSTVLDRDLASVSVGTFVRIQFLGEQTNATTGRSYKAFKIWTAKAE